MDIATTHLSADLDGLASLVAIRRLEGPLELVLPGSMDPTTRKFWTTHERRLPPLLPIGQVRDRLLEEGGGRLVVVDTADPARLGDIGGWTDRFREVIAYDNHPPGPDDLPRAPFPEVGACISGLVLRLAEEGQRPPPLEAGLFLLGIHMDTGHFTYPGTTALDHEAARIALEWGAPATWVGEFLPKGYTAEELERLGQMAASVEHVGVGADSVAVTILEVPGYVPNLSVLLEQLRAAEGWPTAFLLAGSGNRVDVIGRSEGGLDVGRILRSMGGGGHREAGSAALRSMTLHEARAYLRQLLADRAGQAPTAGEVAAHPFVSLPASATVREAGERLRHRRIDSLPLTRGRGKDREFVGLVSRRDVDAALAHGLERRPVGELSLGPPPWIAPDRPLDEARRFLISGGSRLLLVGTPPGDAVGILTRGTVLRALEEPTWSQGGRLPPVDRLRRMLREGLGPTWELVERLGEVAQELGMPLHVVGGTVRDLLLGLPVRDVDLVAEGEGPKVAQQAARRFGGDVRTHAAFGTATWRHQGQEVDLASARAEHYESLASLPRVELHAGLRQDLFRRDFTINAIAISVSPDELGKMHDPFGGWADLQVGVLRVLHGLSFHDDPTRAFRAARFAARFDFQLSPETLGLLHAARKAGAFDRLGKERLGVELERILAQREVVQSFRLLRDWKLLPKIHPRFAAGREFFDRLGRIRDFHSRFLGFDGRGAGGEAGAGEGSLGRGADVPAQELPSQADVLWIEVGASIPKGDRKEWGRMVPGGKERLRRFVWGAERARKAQLRLARAERPSDAGWALQALDLAELIYARATSRDQAVEAWVEWWISKGRAIRPKIDGDTLLARGHPQGKALGRALAAARAAAWDGAGRDEQLAAADRALSR